MWRILRTDRSSRTKRRGLRAGLTAGLALLVFAAVALAVPPDPGKYTGKSGQKRNVLVKVNEDGRIKRFDIDWKAPCEKPGVSWTSGTNTYDRPSDRIKQEDGKFHDFGKYTQKDGAFKGHFRGRIDGEFTTATHAEGKFKIRIRVTRDGETVDHCKKTVSWKANPA